MGEKKEAGKAIVYAAIGGLLGGIPGVILGPIILRVTEEAAKVTVEALAEKAS
jgi:predicted PurR-regulated permease PerM